MSRVEALATGIKIESSDQSPFGVDQGDLQTAKNIGVGTGGGGGHRGHVPPVFYKLLYKLLTTLCVVSDCAPQIKKSFLRL